MRYALGAAGVLVLGALYLYGRAHGDLPGWALGVGVVIVVALSIGQDIARTAKRR